MHLSSSAVFSGPSTASAQFHNSTSVRGVASPLGAVPRDGERATMRGNEGTGYCNNLHHTGDDTHPQTLASSSAPQGGQHHPSSPSSSCAPQQCAGCGRDIVDRYLLHAVDRYWHTTCLKCSSCQVRLGDVANSCFVRSGMILCRPDYIRLFRSSGCCAACGQTIPADELVLRVPPCPPNNELVQPSSRGMTQQDQHPQQQSSDRVYHVDCFACVACHAKLVSGDKYRLIGGSIVCSDHAPLEYPKVMTVQQTTAATSRTLSGMTMTSSSTAVSVGVGGGGMHRAKHKVR